MHVIKHDAKSGEPAKYHVHVVLGERSYLHSDGQVLSTPEYWPTRAGAETVLAKYPDAAPSHEWVHGDVFESPVASNEAMIYFHRKYWSSASVFYVDNQYVDIIDDTQEYLKDAKFLFNINDVASDAVKERQAAIDAKSDAKSSGGDNIVVTKAGRVAAGLVNVAEMQEFVDWAKHESCYNSGTRICDKLADKFESMLSQIEEDER